MGNPQSIAAATQNYLEQVAVQKSSQSYDIGGKKKKDLCSGFITLFTTFSLPHSHYSFNFLNRNKYNMYFSLLAVL